jgi:hypothetical protein
MRYLIAAFGMSMGLVAVVLITMNAVGIDTQSNMNWGQLLAAIAVGTGTVTTHIIK